MLCSSLHEIYNNISFLNPQKTLNRSFFNRITNNTLYITLSCILRTTAGVATGLVSVTSFGVLTKLVPNRVAFITALAEAVISGFQAFGPFLGGLLYDADGYR